MCEYFKNPDRLLSLLATVISIIALWQTQRQIKFSNKQQLFDRRLSDYLVLKDLAKNYREVGERCELNENEGWLFHAGVVLYFLLSNSFFEPASDIRTQPDDIRLQKELFAKRVELRKISEEMSIIFKRDISSVACEFISAYERAVKNSHEFVWAWHSPDTKYPSGMGDELLREREEKRKELEIDLIHLREAFQVLEKENTEQKMKRYMKI